MSEPAWKKLVLELRSSDYKSPYLDRLRARFSASSHGDLAREVLQEMASALGRAEAKVEASIVRLDLGARSIDAMLASEVHDEAWRTEVNERIGAFNREREVALQARWELLVHREALGFRRNDELPTDYPIPAPRALV